MGSCSSGEFPCKRMKISREIIKEGKLHIILNHKAGPLFLFDKGFSST